MTLFKRGHLRLGALEEESDEIPLEYITSWIRKRMFSATNANATLENRILVVQAETASGKSTALPIGVFRLLRDKSTPINQQYRGPNVICTQPRVLTAQTLAKDAVSRSWNPDMVMGKTVGFQTGPLKDKPYAGLIYATAGTLAAILQSLSDADIMLRYKFILVDEAHERSLDNDVILMLLRNFYFRNLGNEKLPFLLLTSATFDPKRYAKYFGVGSDNIIKVVGRTYKITTHYPEIGTDNYPKSAAETAIKIHMESRDAPDRADILIFVPGAGEAKLVKAFLIKELKTISADPSAPVFYLLNINREVINDQLDDYELIFVPVDKLPLIADRRPSRRIIVTTTVAETGLTVDTLRYVIDCGWSRTKETYPPYGATGIITRPAQKSRIKQRMGRAGRMFDGDFYPLYTEKTYAALDEQQLPDIVTSGVGDKLLTIIREQQKQKIATGALAEFLVEDMTMLDPPSPESFMESFSTAVMLGFVSDQAPIPTTWPPVYENATRRGYGLTRLGYIASMFTRTPMEGIRVLLSGYIWNCSMNDLITVVAMFEIELESLYDLKAHKGEPRDPGSLPIGSAALRESLPPFIYNRYGGGIGAIPLAESEEFYFRARLLLSDDFLEAVLLVDRFMDVVNSANSNVNAVVTWCSAVGLKFETMLSILHSRETIIEEMIVAGLNPFRGDDKRLSSCKAENYMECVTALKKCIFDGLRNKLLRWDEKHPNGPGYYSLHGLRVKSPVQFTDALASRMRAMTVIDKPARDVRPLWIVTNEIKLKMNESKGGSAPLQYTPVTSLVSVMDGYVNVDTTF